MRGQPQQPRSVAPFFVEEVRKHLEQQYGAKALYESGLSVTTTLDVRRCRSRRTGRSTTDCGASTSAAASAATQRNVIAQGHTIESFKDERWSRPIAVGDIVPAVVESVGQAGRRGERAR